MILLDLRAQSFEMHEYEQKILYLLDRGIAGFIKKLRFSVMLIFWNEIKSQKNLIIRGFFYFFIF